MSEVESHPEGKDQLTVTTGQHQAIATNRPASIQTGPGGMQTEMEMKVTVDERQRTMEGFRSLGVIAIFLAGLQAQMLAITISNNDTLSDKLTNAFWLAGIFLDVFGAVLATLTARWLEVLYLPDVEFLNNTWAANKAKIPAATPDQSRRHRKGLIEYSIATALFSAPGVVGAGVSLFFLGLMIFIWAQQPLLVSIIATVPFPLLAPIVGCLFIPHEGGRQHIIEILARKKGSW